MSFQETHPKLSLENQESKLVQEAIALYQRSFTPVHIERITISSAPGRVNLIGEHTDYNDGFVLPFAINKKTVIAGTASISNQLQSYLVSSQYPGEMVSFTTHSIVSEDPSKLAGHWSSYIKGVLAAYLPQISDNIHANNWNVNIAVVSDIPMGCGLSSSAALEIAFAYFLETVFRKRRSFPQLSPTQRALLCQRAEHDYCQVPCGIMDQLISSCGVRDHCLLIDCRTEEFAMIPLYPLSGCQDPVLMVVNSNISHKLFTSEYFERVAQCCTATEIAQSAFQSKKISHLRDISLDELEEVRPHMPPIVYRRARHVVTENARTLVASTLVKEHAWKELGSVMYASHVSLRDDFQVSTIGLDALVEGAQTSPGVYGARMTGAGFGGCIIVLLQVYHVQNVMDRLAIVAQEAIQSLPTCFLTGADQGASILQDGECTG
uniref:Galactokinase putative n=1 Tax=Albugo laibachii Nc14 TaxID=890382 RepID=F0WP79_9STRA|nr:galactokinase putative [Albugo laibachii Nc14]|eukprot:CCA23125.1 galactokinase putative [Albugo laibachii Nc14]